MAGIAQSACVEIGGSTLIEGQSVTWRNPAMPSNLRLLNQFIGIQRRWGPSLPAGIETVLANDAALAGVDGVSK
ncbi:MAG: hypothetical protein P9F19_04770 [Candidatus Contendobacter sp.]|nr:hypothetical protein [Candidatus Contendobacter sp.]MDG4556690.1 hypothetical protein [Candidatus Contendobacter sp.]